MAEEEALAAERATPLHGVEGGPTPKGNADAPAAKGAAAALLKGVLIIGCARVVRK